MKFVAQNKRGFANSWEVLAFRDLADAKDYIAEAHFPNQPKEFQPRLIPKSKVGYWVGERPKAFSGAAYIIVRERNAPYYGYVVVGFPCNGMRAL